MKLRKNKKPKSSLKVYVLGNLGLMLAVILFFIDMLNISIEVLAGRKLKEIYLKYYPESSVSEASDYAKTYLEGLNEYDPDHKEMEKEINYYIAKFSSWATISLYIVVIVIIFIFGVKIIKRISKELKKLDTALENFSRSAAANNEISEINSDIKEFNNICTSYNRLVTRLKESENERTQLESEQRRMIADISHDIRTPITVMQGYAKAISDNMVDEETKQKYLDSICRKSETVAELVSTLHEYSKLEHPDFDFNMEEGDICEYFRSYLAMKYQDLDLAGFFLEADIPEEKMPFSFDHKQLNRVFENLIINSFRHNSAGTTIYTEIRNTEGGIIIRIGDNGKGIPKELRETIFDPFVVGNKSRTGAKSSGLGLAISRKIVEAHNGTIALIDDESGRMNTLYEIVLHRA
ncbi:sensor histidine kinase KdpD [uncultured Ruminococcus sp.]|uniref:sensor histidine kinase n=1 Tax=uncultured Ruminococcus sp. TaxID=165186 RepID=UPI0026242201|nr:HAMP domain-containing sensor histidine kinase [uncultured Ruminococcus sp.]